jgi:glycosyltransferase involved in cell wall biosynthesis
MISAAASRLDIVIPVYNEGANILPALQSLMRAVKTPLRVLICYDREDDNTLTAIRKHRDALVRSRSSLYATSSAVHTAQC